MIIDRKGVPITILLIAFVFFFKYSSLVLSSAHLSLLFDDFFFFFFCSMLWSVLFILGKLLYFLKICYWAHIKRFITLYSFPHKHNLRIHARFYFSLYCVSMNTFQWFSYFCYFWLYRLVLQVIYVPYLQYCVFLYISFSNELYFHVIV